MPRPKKIKPKSFLAPRGTHDILPEDQKYRERIRQVAKNLLPFYGFARIDTPHFEETGLFLQAVGAETDIVEKQMYSFKTEGGDALTLRPEGTASVIRAYIQNGFINQPHPVKFYYSGAFFRHESPQRGRFREFNQLGLEIIGDENPIADAEIIHVFSVFLKELGVSNFVFHLNSVGCQECRPHYRSALVQYYRSKIKGLCRDCKRRFKKNPLRLLDCKEEKCQIYKKNAPQMIDGHLCEPCKRHFTSFLEFLEENNLPYSLNPYLVRGLDYYTRTVFEIFTDNEPGTAQNTPETESKTNEEKNPAAEEKKGEPMALGAPEESNAAPIPAPEKISPLTNIALGGGGRYDNLIALLGGRPEPAVGASLGIERLIHLMKHLRLKVPGHSKSKVFFVQLGDLAKKKSFKVIEELRKAGVNMDESLGRDSVKSQLKIADKSEVEYSLILGQKEAIDNTIIVREMSSGIQEVVPQEKFIEILKKKLKK